MVEAFRLIPALQVILRTRLEFDEKSFEELNPAQYAAYAGREGEPNEKIYRIVHFEPEAVERTPEKVTLELSIVTESQKELLLRGVRFVYRATEEMRQPNPSFEERLDYLRQRLPQIVLGDESA